MSFAYPAARILVSLANIAIAALIVLSVLPLVTDQFDIDAPAIDDFDWSFSEGNLTVSAPIVINNGGFFDVSDVAVALSVTNASGYQLMSDVDQWGTIGSGGRSTRQIGFSLDVDDMLDDGLEWMMTHSDRLLVKVSVSAKYTLKLIGFSAEYELNIPWDGLVKGYGIGSPSLQNSSGAYGIQLPYYLSTADFLQGLSGNCMVTLFNGTGSEISSASEDFLLGTNHSSVLSLSLDPAAAIDLLMNNQTLSAEIIVRLPSGSEIAVHRQIEWTAPMHW